MTDVVKDYRKLLRRNAWRVLLLAIFGLFLNFSITYIVRTSGLPIWVDMTGTVVVAILGGYIPSIFVGFFTNVLTSLFVTPTSIYYCVTSVVIAICTTYFYRKGWFERVLTILPYFIVIPIITTAFDEILPMLIEGLSKNGVIMDFCYEVLDKTVTLAIAFVIIKCVPAKIKNTLRMRFWQQRPLSAEDEQKAIRMHCRFMSMRSKIVCVLTVSLVMISIIATSISFILYRSSLISEYTDLARNAAQQISYMIDPNKIEYYIEKGEQDPEYMAMKEKLNAIKQSSQNIKYLYVYKIVDNGCIVVFDLDSNEDQGDPAGTLVTFDDDFIPIIPDLLQGKSVDPIISDNKYGWLLSVYIPIKDYKGRGISYVGTDISMDSILKNEVSFLLQMLFLFTGFLIAIIYLVIWLVDYGIIYPLNSIALRSKEFVFNSHNSLDRNVQSFKELDIHTGDEIEHLYSTLLKMVENSSEYIEEIQKQKARVTKMQNSMTMVLADMVESRDENTGLHIHKTAKYVQIILEKMQELGLHPDFINDKYIQNVVNSAPLHDIGKIKIPDQILNKPGKLTPEEFEIMKTHASAGGEIIEQVIAQVPNSSYLKEAKFIATYHHEKWDGSGYPTGLSKTDIPFSARVMAVADVFDALVSKRVYKPAMPLEKAFNIIKESAGNHFDPEIVEVFFAAKDQICEAKKMFDDYTEKNNANASAMA